MATLSKLIPGQVVYSVERRRMGNTTRSTTAVFNVQIVEIHPTHVVARWNGNSPNKFWPREIAKWKVNKPVLVNSGFGQRLALKSERELLTTVARNNCP